MTRLVAVVTGAGTGIGRAASLALAGGGFDVALIGRRREPLDAVAAEIERTGAAALVLPADVTDETAIDGALSRSSRRMGASMCCLTTPASACRAADRRDPGRRVARGSMST